MQLARLGYGKLEIMGLGNKACRRNPDCCQRFPCSPLG
nr:MAG TPA: HETEROPODATOXIN 2 [Caudoviricetes sp.]